LLLGDIALQLSHFLTFLSLFRFLAATQGEEAGQEISEEERAFRQQEAALLAKISAPPTIGEESLKQLVAEKKLKIPSRSNAVHQV
jgi:hypothetical protein